jgi:hypothetical protein
MFRDRHCKLNPRARKKSNGGEAVTVGLDGSKKRRICS